jgi:hypothetical protein
VCKQIAKAINRVDSNALAEWHAFCRLPFPPSLVTSDGAVTEHEYETWIQAVVRAFPTLLKTVLSILRVSPTEAAVERAFSKCKHTVPAVRSRISAHTVRSLMIVQSFAHCRRKQSAAIQQRSPQDAPSPQARAPSGVTPEPSQDQRQGRRVHKDTAARIIELYAATENVPGPQEGAGMHSRLRPSSYGDKCLVCERLFREHECSKKVICKGPVCAGMRKAMASCAGYSEAQLESIEDTESFLTTWNCQVCIDVKQGKPAGRYVDGKYVDHIDRPRPNRRERSVEPASHVAPDDGEPAQPPRRQPAANRPSPTPAAPAAGAPKRKAKATAAPQTAAPAAPAPHETIAAALARQPAAGRDPSRITRSNPAPYQPPPMPEGPPHDPFEFPPELFPHMYPPRPLTRERLQLARQQEQDTMDMLEE